MLTVVNVYSPVVLPARTSYSRNHGEALVSSLPLISPLRFADITILAGRMSVNGDNSSEAKYTVNSLFPYRGWTNKSRPLTLHQRDPLMLLTYLAVKMSQVSFPTTFLYHSAKTISNPAHSFQSPALMHTLEDLEHFAQDGHNSIAQASVREVKAALERLVVKMDGLEAGFDKIAERSCECLSSSRSGLLV